MAGVSVVASTRLSGVVANAVPLNSESVEFKEPIEDSDVTIAVEELVGVTMLLLGIEEVLKPGIGGGATTMLEDSTLLEAELVLGARVLLGAEVLLAIGLVHVISSNIHDVISV